MPFKLYRAYYYWYNVSATYHPHEVTVLCVLSHACGNDCVNEGIHYLTLTHQTIL